MNQENCITILGVRINRLRFSQAVERLWQLSDTSRVTFAVTVNPEMIVEAQRNLPFQQAINAADLLVPDGIGLLPAANFCHSAFAHKPLVIRLIIMMVFLLKLLIQRSKFYILPERISGADLLLAVAEEASRKQVPIFLLGGGDNEADLARSALKKRFPNLAVSTDGGTVNVENESDQEFQRVTAVIQAAKPKFIFVAFGHPKQELWIYRHRLALPVGVYMGVGGTFAYLAGSKQRAHPIIQQLGLEWFWRLIIEPTRLQRILTAVVIFPWLVVRHSSTS